MTQPAGWYDDPQDPSQFRYWDGVIWSGNVTPKAAPTPGQYGVPNGVTAAAARPAGSGSYGEQGLPSAPGSFGTPQQGYGQQDGQAPAYGQQGGQPPGYGQYPGYAPQQSASGWQSNAVPSTPDGVPLSGWWKRVLAQILDRFIVFFLALPVTFFPLKRAFAVVGDVVQQTVDAANTGTTTPRVSQQVSNQLLEQMGKELALVSLIVLVVYVIYEVAFLTWTGATLGKRAVGISVRLRDEPGPAPLLAVMKRTAVKEGGGFFGSVPVLGNLLSLFSLINVLWPLWDNKNQAIHDKVAATNVVVGPQPKRNA